MDPGFRHLDYLHVLINPLPVYGGLLAVLLLGAAMILKNRPAQLLGLALMIVSAGSAWPTYLTGERAYQKVYLIADSDGQRLLDEHKQRAEKLIWVFYVVAAVALAAAVLPSKVPKAAAPLVWLTLIIAVISLGIGGWIAKAGGQIRHPEFRNPKRAASP
jgi:hypothetical protein